MPKATSPDSLEFYVYALLDRRKPGKYSYGGFDFKYEPFYIGKGLKSRGLSHIRVLKRMGMDATLEDFRHRSSFRRYCKVRAIKRESGRLPIAMKVCVRLNERDAFNFERRMIARIGRQDLDEGPLINAHDGGLGGSSRQRCTKQTRRLISENSRRMHQDRDEEHAAEVSAKIIRSSRKRWDRYTEDEKERRRNLGRACFDNKTEQEMKAIRKRMSDGRKRYFANMTDAEREAHSARLRAASYAGWEKRRRNQALKENQSAETNTR